MADVKTLSVAIHRGRIYTGKGGGELWKSSTNFSNQTCMHFPPLLSYPARIISLNGDADVLSGLLERGIDIFVS